MLGWLRQWVRRYLGRDAGARGEALAARHLERELGCRVVARNWRNPADRREELDLIVRDGEALVFVEVKTRTADALVPGFYAVNQRKRRVMRRAARAYLARLAHPPATVRFDVVEVELPAAGEKSPPVVRHYANLQLFAKHYEPDR